MTGSIIYPTGLAADDLIADLRSAGAVFALAFGSRVEGAATPPRSNSDLDIGAWWGAEPPHSWDVPLPAGVDLTVLDTAPLRVAGRVAMHGVVLFEDDPAARVRWQAQTRKRYVDELPRWQRADEVFRRAVLDG